jgi:1-aminocyclopropane-1-carboxylate synthase
MLLVTPTYGMLYNDVGVLAGVSVVDVPIEPGSPILPSDLSAACDRALTQGLRPKMLFLLNPDNPLGTIRSTAELQEILTWVDAQGSDFHLVSDEIYALSVYGEGAAFTSVAQLRCDNAGGEEAGELYLGDNTHILWGASKDFCASGLRMGILFSHNSALLSALSNVGYFSAACNSMQDEFAVALTDTDWVEFFIHENHKRLREARNLVCDILDTAGVPYIRPVAGLFIWMDLSEWLCPPRGFEQERRLTDELFSAGVLLTPGEATHSVKPGCFRCCFAWPTELATVQEGCTRLVSFLLSHDANRAL